MLANFKKFVQDEEAPTAVEYALLGSLIAVAIIGTVALLGTRINGTFTRIAERLG